MCTDFRQSHYGQQNGGLLSQNSNNLNGLANNMNGMNGKLFSSLQTHSNLQSNSSSPVGHSLQQQIMMQSPTVNMSAIAAYGQQPALLANSLNNQYPSSLNTNSNQNNNNNYVDDSVYSYHTSSQKQISQIQWYEVEIKGKTLCLSGRKF